MCSDRVVWCVFALDQHTLVGVHAEMETPLVNLTRKHGVKIQATFPCSVEECGLAAGKVVGYESVKSAARMNSAVIIFVGSIDKANTLVENGVVIRDTYVPVVPLATPSKKITLSNVPPFISDDILVRELSRHGKIVSPMKKVHSGCKAPELKHVVSHRRQLYMILNEKDVDLTLAFKIKVDGFDYVIFATSENMKCFNCGREGHIVRACPEKKAEANVARNVTVGGAAGAAADQIEKEAEAVHAEGHVGQGGGEGQEIHVDSQRSEGGQEEGDAQTDSQGERQAEKSQTNGTEKKDSGLQKVATGMVFGPGSIIPGKQCTTEVTVEMHAVSDPGQDDIDMSMTDDVLKVPQLKRKISSSQGSAKAKKVTDSEESVTKTSKPASECDSDSSDDGDIEFSVENIREFLRKTKNKKNVKVGDHFSDSQLFAESARQQMSSGEGGFTDQEMFRLRKFVSKIRAEVNNDDDE